MKKLIHALLQNKLPPINQADFNYKSLVNRVLNEGELVFDSVRGCETYRVFGDQREYDLRVGFPLLTTKKIHMKSIFWELIWFLRGDTNIEFLKKHRVSIWDEWANEDGDLGPVYGKQWRDFNGVDQIADLIENLKKNPYSRRHIISAWNPADVPNMALPPCHLLFQFSVNKDQELSCQLYQRSADIALGVPFNIASYALLTHLIAYYTNLKPGKFVHTIGDAHIYSNHVNGLKQQIKRIPFKAPEINIDNKGHLEMTELVYPSNVFLTNYEAHPTIKFDVFV
jgi:thymidylate synthase